MNFHLFVAITTFAFYIVLKSYKYSLLNNNSKNKSKNKSNLIYILFIPTILYITHFLFIIPSSSPVSSSSPISSPLPVSSPISLQAPVQSQYNLLNTPYPVSSSTSYSSSSGSY